MHSSERVYHFFLRLYPQDFRERYGLEMTQTFRDAHRQARLENKAFAFWFRTLTDAISSAIREHTRGTGGSMSPIVRVGAVCFVITGLYDTYRLSRLLWMDWGQMSDRPETTVLLLIIGVLAFAGLQAMRTKPASSLEKFGFVMVWIGGVLSGVNSASQQILHDVVFPNFWLEPMRTLSAWIAPIVVVAMPLTTGGLIAVTIGRTISCGFPLQWNQIPLEVKLLFGLVAFMASSFLRSSISIDVFAPRTVYIPFVLSNLPGSLLIIALGVALWKKSSVPRVPPRAKTA
jgi:hypothetical protein